MSSDSEESHASAHDEDTADHGTASIAPDSSIQSRDVQESGLLPDYDGEKEREKEREKETENLLAIEGDSNGLTFARPKKVAKEHDEDSVSDVEAVRPTTELPLGSPRSASTPDDTPSIQVWHPSKSTHDIPGLMV